MNKLVVFDLDGTLCYTIEDIALSVNFALKNNRYPVFSQDDVMKLVGNSVAFMIRNAMPSDSSETEFNKVYKDYTDHYAIHLCDHVKIYPEVTETLNLLKEKGYLLAVISNKPNKPCKDMISKLFPRELFSFVLGMVPSLIRKPDAQPMNFVFDYLDGDKNSSFYVGDSEVDIQFAANSGIKCVSCAWGYRNEKLLTESGAEKIIHSFSELKQIIP